MEARKCIASRHLRLSLSVVLTSLVSMLWSPTPASTQYVQYVPQRVRQARFQNSVVTTQNFVVRAPTRQFAERVARDAEKFRKQLAVEWLGRELKPWTVRCPIVVRIEPLAGGRTSFAFQRGGGTSTPVDWDMEIFGPPERILDSVLPHEVTHTIFATHFGRPLPRWADEGACTTVEHESERKKNHKMLIRFLSQRPSKGIPFNRMFAMKEYPREMLPLYAQAYSLARFLIQQKGKREFIRYVEIGLRGEDRGLGLHGWGQATKQIYGYDDLSDLQIQWLTWVKKGSPKIAPRTSIANLPNQLRTQTKNVFEQQRNDTSQLRANVNPNANFIRRSSIETAAEPLERNWYVQQASGHNDALRNASAANTNSGELKQRGANTSVAKKTYQPGSIANAQLFRQVPDDAFINPNSQAIRTKFDGQLRSRPRIYR